FSRTLAAGCGTDSQPLGRPPRGLFFAPPLCPSLPLNLLTPGMGPPRGRPPASPRPPRLPPPQAPPPPPKASCERLPDPRHPAACLSPTRFRAWRGPHLDLRQR